MKKLQRLAIVFVAVVMSITVLTACWNKPIKDNGDYITIKFGDGGVKTSQEFLGGALDELSEDEELHIKYGADMGFGKWLAEIGTLIPDASSEYIALYATTDDLNHVDPLTKKEIDGVTYYYSLKGIDQMPIIDGVTYLFIIESF